MRYVWPSLAVLLICSVVAIYMWERAREFYTGAHRAVWRPAKPGETPGQAEPEVEADPWADLTAAMPDVAATFLAILAARWSGQDVEDEPTLRTQTIEIPRDGRTET